MFPCLLLFCGFVFAGNQTSSSSSESLSPINIDIDGNGQLDAFTDGLLILRSMFGLTGSTLVAGAVASDAIYTNVADIESRIDDLGNHLDIDNNGAVDALTDGLIILRYLTGYTGDSLVNGVVAINASRASAAEIESYMAVLSSLDVTPPTFSSYHIFNIQENKIVIGSVFATDEETDDELITFSISGSELLITPDGLLSFVTAPDYETKSSYSAMVTATDGINSSVQEITINVTDIDDEAPVFTSIGDFSGNENRPWIGWVTATDIDSDDESIRFRVSGSELKISPAGALRFVEAPDYEAKSSYTATVTATDGKNSSTQIVTVTVIDLDDVAPVFTSEANFVVEENQIAIGTVTATDIDTDDGLITFSISGSELLITPDGLLSFVTAPDYETKSSYSAMVTATDGINSSVQEITINVTDIDDEAPVFTSIGDFSGNENRPWIGWVTATDIDSDDESIRFRVSGSELKISPAGALRFVEAPDYEAKSSYTATVTATDGKNSSTQIVTVTVIDLDDVAPVFTSEANFVVEENQIAIGTVTATDIDTDDGLITYSVSGSEFLITPDGVLSFASAPDFETRSSYSATLTATDGANSVTQDITVTVTDANDLPPVFTSEASFSAAENQTAIGTVTATDIDTNDGLIAYSVSGSELLITSDGVLSFASAPDYETKSSFSATVTATDGINSTTQIITVTVTDVDDTAPVFTSEASYSAAENQTAIGTLTATDIDTDDGLIIFSVSGSEL